MPDFTHLHTYSHYSLLTALSKIPDLVEEAKKNGMHSLALTDAGNLYGAIEFYQAAKDAGIKPILGMETWIAPQGVTSPETEHLILLAKNNEGYQNLIRLSSFAQTEGYSTSGARVDPDTLREHSAYLFCLSGINHSGVYEALAHGDYERAKSCAAAYAEIFGSNFFLEVAPSSLWDNHATLTKHIQTLAEELNLPLVVTGESRYLSEDEAPSLDILLAIKNKTTIHNPERFSMADADFSFKSPTQMEELGSDLPHSAFDN
ncbi:MAG: DNA polymerase III subunit alpha, partial [Parcubacteria group bacterium SW_4_49_11]